MSLNVVCFFFQAEDGIRDYKVTGVQTCALPILMADTGGTWAAPAVFLKLAISVSGRIETAASKTTLRINETYSRRSALLDSRSEERRVGKEGRSRWWPDH